MDLTEAEDIKKRWQENTELYKKGLNDLDHQNGVVTHPEPHTLECEVKRALGSTERSEVKVKVAQSCPILCNPMDYRNSPGQNTGMGSLSLFQGIFPAQGSNPGFLLFRQILYQLRHKGSPRILECVAYPFSSGSSWPRIRPWPRGLLHCRWILYQLSYQGSPRKITMNKALLVEVMGLQLSYFKSQKMMLWKCWTQYASKFGKLNSGHRTRKGQFSFQSRDVQSQRMFKLPHNCIHFTC